MRPFPIPFLDFYLRGLKIVMLGLQMEEKMVESSIEEEKILRHMRPP